MRAQPVGATPSGIKLFSKVVFMTQGKRFGLSAAQKSDMWCRWKAGQSLHEIGRAFGKEHSSIRCLVSRHGGFVPAVRRNKPTVTRHQTTNGRMLLAEGAPDLMQRLSGLPTAPHVALLRGRKSKPFPLGHKHHL